MMVNVLYSAHAVRVLRVVVLVYVCMGYKDQDHGDAEKVRRRADNRMRHRVSCIQTKLTNLYL